MAKGTCKYRCKTKAKTKTNAEASIANEIASLENEEYYNPAPPPYEQGPHPIVVVPNDPKDLGSVYDKVNFHLYSAVTSTVKMINGLLMDGYKLEAEEIGSQVMDKANMRGVVIFTGVIGEYVGMGRTLDALKAYKRMLASKVYPNAYTCSVLIEALAGDPDPIFLGVTKKYVLEMVGMGMRPSVNTYVFNFKTYFHRSHLY